MGPWRGCRSARTRSEAGKFRVSLPSSAVMASLARIIRPSIARRVVRSLLSSFPCQHSSLFFFFQPAFARTITTSADTTQLQDTITDQSQPFTVKLHEDSFRTYKCDPPSFEVQVQKDQLLKMYKDMQTMRRMEMAADTLYKAKLIRGFCHLAIGQVSPRRLPLGGLLIVV